jgi:hypothetical protein
MKRGRHMLSAAAAYVHNLFANAEEEQVTEHEVQAKMLKDLNFDKMSSRELQAFLQEKKFQDDVQIMLGYILRSFSNALLSRVITSLTRSPRCSGLLVALPIRQEASSIWTRRSSSLNPRDTCSLSTCPPSA